VKQRIPIEDVKRSLTTKAISAFHGRYERKGECDCWEWQGPLSYGYGVFCASGRPIRAHRVAYFLATQTLPFCLDHLCRNRKCVNPAHLEPVSDRENILRGVGLTAINHRKTHCKRGHPLTGDNLLHIKLGRECKTCNRLVSNEWKRKHPRWQGKPHMAPEGRWIPRPKQQSDASRGGSE